MSEAQREYLLEINKFLYNAAIALGIVAGGTAITFLVIKALRLDWDDRIGVLMAIWIGSQLLIVLAIMYVQFLSLA